MFAVVRAVRVRTVTLRASEALLSVKLIMSVRSETDAGNVGRLMVVLDMKIV